MINFKRYAPAFMEMEDDYYKERVFNSVDEIITMLNIDSSKMKKVLYCKCKYEYTDHDLFMIHEVYPDDSIHWWVLGYIKSDEEINLPEWNKNIHLEIT